MIAPPPEPVWIVRDLERPEPSRAWVVHSHFGIDALAMPVHPINSGAGPDATEPAPDHPKEITSMPEPIRLVPETARDAEVDALSAGDCGFIAARLADRYPDVFDELVRDLRAWPSSPAKLSKETTR